MNIYSEKLHTQVSDILCKQQTETDNLASMVSAEMFTSYYAAGAVISAASVLQALKDKQAFYALLKKQTNESNAICSNLVLSINQTNQYQNQSVINAGVAGTNIQEAANAVVKLAGDIGSICNIIEASLKDTEIHNRAEALNICIGQIANYAENASLLAMEASILSSEVSAVPLHDKALALNAAMDGLMNTVAVDYDNIAASVLANEKIHLAALTEKKKTEGRYANSRAALNAAENTYTSINMELNHGLTSSFTGEQQTEIEVSFNLIRSPFAENVETPFYPVQDYFIFLVKEKNKSIFTNELAESVHLQFPDRYIHLNDLNADVPQVHKTYNLQITGSEKKKYVLKDTDGKEIIPGVNYVAFLLGVYQFQYKKILNDYSDFLSAPSQAFCVTHLLAVAHSIKADIANTDWPKSISFSVEETPDTEGLVQYRCILLPQSEKHNGNLIDFLFNLQLAQQVYAANYIVAEKSDTELNSWTLSLPISTTDNFGNEVKSGNYYIPVILSVFNGKNENSGSFTNSWTGYSNTPLLYIN